LRAIERQSAQIKRRGAIPPGFVGVSARECVTVAVKMVGGSARLDALNNTLKFNDNFCISASSSPGERAADCVFFPQHLPEIVRIELWAG